MPNNPFVNIIIINPSANSYPVQNNFYPHPALNQALPFNPNYFNNQRFQYPMVQAQPYQQPSFTYMNYPICTMNTFSKILTKIKRNRIVQKNHSKSKDKKL